MKIKKIIELHGLMLLNLYGVEEKKIKDNPEALKTFVELLSEEIDDEKNTAKRKRNPANNH